MSHNCKYCGNLVPLNLCPNPMCASKQTIHESMLIEIASLKIKLDDAGIQISCYEGSTHALEDQLKEAEQTAEKLRKGIQDFLSGNYTHPRSCRPLQCPHKKYYYEDCGLCDEQHFINVLEDK